MILWGIVAGGRGVRFGQPKATATHHGRSFLDTMLSCIDAARDPDDRVAVGLAHDADGTSGQGRTIVRDIVAAPGPAHSIARLAECASGTGDDLVFMPVDMLALTPATLHRFRIRLDENRGLGREAVIVARSGDRIHWVLGAVPSVLHERIVTGAESVSAVQSLLRLCPLDYLDVDHDELLDVNTPESLPVERR